jgi:hypothetical protein
MWEKGGTREQGKLVGRRWEQGAGVSMWEKGGNREQGKLVGRRWEQGAGVSMWEEGGSRGALPEGGEVQLEAVVASDGGHYGLGSLHSSC